MHHWLAHASEVRRIAWMRARPMGRAARADRGQSLTELAIILPAFILIMLLGLDFGRIFLGWVNLNNSVRVAANFAAQHPNAWDTPGGDSDAQAEYQRLAIHDADVINCALPSPVPGPVFPGGKAIGEPARVGISCSFQVLTPVISNIVGGSVGVSASAAFPIRYGVIEGIPVQPAVPTPTPAPTAEPTPEPTGTPSPTPTPMCVVPDLTAIPLIAGTNTQFAQDLWGSKGHGGTPGAGFASAIDFQPQIGKGNGNNYAIGWQSIPAGNSEACDASTVITVTP